MIELIAENYTWVFSGIGGVVITIIVSIILHRKRQNIEVKLDKQVSTISNIKEITLSEKSLKLDDHFISMASIKRIHLDVDRKNADPRDQLVGISWCLNIYVSDDTVYSIKSNSKKIELLKDALESRINGNEEGKDISFKIYRGGVLEKRLVDALEYKRTGFSENNLSLDEEADIEFRKLEYQWRRYCH